MLSSKQDIIERANNIRNDIEKAESTNSIIDINTVRLNILSLLEKAVHFYVKENIFNLWVKACLWSAIAATAMKNNWLRLGSVYISTILAKKRRLAVLRCSHLSIYAALRCSPNQRFLSQSSEM